MQQRPAVLSLLSLQVVLTQSVRLWGARKRSPSSATRLRWASASLALCGIRQGGVRFQSALPGLALADQSVTSSLLNPAESDMLDRVSRTGTRRPRNGTLRNPRARTRRNGTPRTQLVPESGHGESGPGLLVARAVRLLQPFGVSGSRGSIHSGAALSAISEGRQPDGRIVGPTRLRVCGSCLTGARG